MQNRLAVQSLIALGKHLKSESEIFAGQIENIKIKAQTQQVNLENQIKSLKERSQFYAQQISDLNLKIEAFEQATEQSAKYECERIGEYCPFIKAINKQHFEQRALQKTQLLEQKELLEAKIVSENLTQKLENLQLEFQNLQSGSLQEGETQLLVQRQKENEEKIQILRTFFLQVDFKKLESLAEEYKVLSAKILSVENLLIKQEELAQQVQSLQEEKAQLQ